MYSSVSGQRVGALLIVALLAGCISACSETETDVVPGTEPRYETNRLCPLVPARDPAAAAFPPAPPVRAYGTDLGWTYERDGVIQILFGDTWQRIDICPLQLNDDSLATLATPAADWPGFTARESIPDADCPELTFAVDAAGTAFAPIELRRWDGVVVPLGPLNTPVTGFFDGQKEWSIFLVAGGQACTNAESTAGATCSDELSPQAADLVCGFVGTRPLCVDPTSTTRDEGQQGFYLHIAERVGPSSYISRAMFLTNKYLNLTARTVRAFDPDAGTHDYKPGTSALLMWGRPGFGEQSADTQAPPYFMYHSLPFEVAGEQIVFHPQYFRGSSAAGPSFGTSQIDAVPLYGDELTPVNHAAVSYIEPLSRWLMIYGGSVADYVDPTPGVEISGDLYARTALDPWGPWTEPKSILTEEVVAQDMVCGRRAPVGCLARPDPQIRPQCLEDYDNHAGGVLYGANIIDTYTRAVRPTSGPGPAADIFWNISTWHPYSVVLVRTHIELE